MNRHFLTARYSSDGSGRLCHGIETPFPDLQLRESAGRTRCAATAASEDGTRNFGDGARTEGLQVLELPIV